MQWEKGPKALEDDVQGVFSYYLKQQGHYFQKHEQNSTPTWETTWIWTCSSDINTLKKPLMQIRIGDPNKTENTMWVLNDKRKSNKIKIYPRN